MTPHPTIGGEPSETEHDFREFIDCWDCGGEGYIADCFDGFCMNAEEGCDFCTRACSTCRGKGGWYAPEDDDAKAPP